MARAVTSPPQRPTLKVGSYAGDGIDNRDINLMIDLDNKNNVYVIVKALSGARAGCHRINYNQGDLTMRYDAAGDEANVIQQFTSTGFQVGTNNSVNSDGTLYRYIVFYED